MKPTKETNRADRSDTQPHYATLTPAEEVTWQLYRGGMSRPEIARQIGVQLTTVNVRIQTAKQKLACVEADQQGAA
jgi:DNA-binding NarL/FixJ family response regulator